MNPGQALHWLLVEAVLNTLGVDIAVVSHILLMTASCQIHDWTNLSLRPCLALSWFYLKHFSVSAFGRV
jgi:hypothetical protein